MKYAIEMVFKAWIYMPGSIQTGSGIHLLTGGIHKCTYTHAMY
jgi:hypothetical protein